MLRDPHFGVEGLGNESLGGLRGWIEVFGCGGWKLLGFNYSRAQVLGAFITYERTIGVMKKVTLVKTTCDPFQFPDNLTHLVSTAPQHGRAFMKLL